MRDWSALLSRVGRCHRGPRTGGRVGKSRHMRFGLVGTGPWAERVHGPALSGTPGIELVGVWGRSEERASALATDLGTTPYVDLDALVADVDAVAFAVPPDVQAELA